MSYYKRYLWESTSTPYRPQIPWLKSHLVDSDNYIDYMSDGTVDWKVWPTQDKLYSQHAFSSGLCEIPHTLGIFSARYAFVF